MSENNSSPYDLNANVISSNKELEEDKGVIKSPYDLNSHGGLPALIKKIKPLKKKHNSSPYDLNSHGGLPGLLKRNR